MDDLIKLAAVDDSKYSDYRYDVILNAYKWDPQVEDSNTVSRHAVLLSQQTAEDLAHMAEQLSAETMKTEELLVKNPEAYAKELGISRSLKKALRGLEGYNSDSHVRLMRFDFHPSETGWAVSEVNSDVPGGFAEASVLPQIACRYLEGCVPGVDFSSVFTDALSSKIKKDGSIALVHATSYSDDRQVMQFIGDRLVQRGFRAVYAGPDHLRWQNRKAVSVLEGHEGDIDGIIRFFPLEWLANLQKRTGWQGYFSTITPSCNFPVSVFAQSKRLPLVWDRLGAEIPYWKSLLPETVKPELIDPEDRDWIYKPAFGRVGEGVSVWDAVSSKELEDIRKSVKKNPEEWTAQRMFKSRALSSQRGGSYHLCIGVFTVNTEFAGFYGRISPTRRIDSKAEDIPVLIMKGGEIHG